MHPKPLRGGQAKKQRSSHHGASSIISCPDFHSAQILHQPDCLAAVLTTKLISFPELIYKVSLPRFPLAPKPHGEQ